jgi:hypothetical protein
MKRCCICDKQIGIGHNALCKEHWEQYNDQLQAPWLRFLIASEHRERRHRRKTNNYLSIEDLAGTI